MKKSNIVLEASQLTVAFGKRSALWDVSLKITDKQLVGIIGPNGAGKSTFLKAALKELKPISGKIDFPDILPKEISYVPQKDSVDWDFPITVFDAVLMGRYGKMGLFKRMRKSDKEATLFALEQLGLLEVQNRQISELSGGQKQRMFIARSLVKDPKIFLMDEPFAGVDITSEEVIVSILQKLKQEGKTIIVVHHDLSSVEKYFDSLILLRTRLIASGPVREVFTKGNLVRTYGKNDALFDELTTKSLEYLSSPGPSDSKDLI